MRWITWALPAILAFPSACTDRPNAVTAVTAGFTVRDSVGIEIIDNTPPGAGLAHTFSLDPEPELQVGALDGPAAYQFAGIASVVRLADGSLVVSDRGSGEVRVFDETGSFVKAIGRKGDGPGEFGAAPVLASSEDGILRAWDPRNRRFSSFRISDEELIEESAIVGPGEELTRRIGITSDGWRHSAAGDLWVVWQEGFDTGSPDNPVTSDVALRVQLAVDGGADAHLVATIPWARIRTQVPATAFDPFAPRGSWAGARGSGFTFTNDGESDRVIAYQREGDVVWISELGRPRVPVTGRARDDARDHVIADRRARGVDPGPTLQLLDDLEPPETVGPFMGLLASDSEVWVHRRNELRSDEDKRYDVISHAGRWLGSIEVPAVAGRPLELEGDHLITVWRDEFDVEYLRVYRIDRSAGPGVGR